MIVEIQRFSSSSSMIINNHYELEKIRFSSKKRKNKVLTHLCNGKNNFLPHYVQAMHW